MNTVPTTRREFLKLAGTVAGARLVGPSIGLGQPKLLGGADSQTDESKADYPLRIAASPIEIAHNRIVSGITSNGQFPGPSLRVKDGQQFAVDDFNDTAPQEQFQSH